MNFFAVVLVLAAAAAAANNAGAVAASNNAEQPQQQQQNDVADNGGRTEAGNYDDDNGSQADWHYYHCRSGTYSCTWDRSGWRVCRDGKWVIRGYCPYGTKCHFNYENGSPYCLPRRHHHHPY
ncbi:hypothetical protein VTK56DRAFT_4257 [Thermocarpiscus australiensis]